MSEQNKKVEEEKEKEDEVTGYNGENFKKFEDWWNSLKPQYRTPDIIFRHFEKYFSPKNNLVECKEKEDSLIKDLFQAIISQSYESFENALRQSVVPLEIIESAFWNYFRIKKDEPF